MRLFKSRADDEACARLSAGVAAYALGLAEDSIVDSARGSVEVAFARQVAMYLCHTGFELSLARVAVAFYRDRSTVAHACHQIEDRRDEPQFDLWISALEAMLQEAPAPHVQAAVQR